MMRTFSLLLALLMGAPHGARPTATPQVLGKLLSANFNTTADQAIPISYGHAEITQIIVTNASTSLTLAVGGFYTGAGKTGTIMVAATQVYSALTGPTLALVPVLAIPVRVTSAQQVFFALTTAQGSAAIADIYVLGVAIDQ